MSMEDAFTILHEELDKIQGYTKQTHSSFSICCPFHDEKTPSCGINISYEAKVPLGFFHCFAGETRVTTYDGTKDIRSLSGSIHKILTDGGQWVDAEFSNYGKQQLTRIKLTRNGVEKTIRATADHDWYLKRRKSAIKTRDLTPGMYLESNACVLSDVCLDDDGVRHGFVFGDGTTTRDKTSGSVKHTRAYLVDEKITFMSGWFTNFGTHYSYDYGGRDQTFQGKQVIVDNLPTNWKSLPRVTRERDYIYGFLAGLIAADGSVALDGSVCLNNYKKSTLQRVRDIATRIGINTYGITKQMRKGYGEKDSAIYRIYFARGSFPVELLLNPKHKERFAAIPTTTDYLRWKVTAVEKTDSVEDVFCCVVPGTHRFTLEDNILTGNCYGCGESGPWNKLAEKMGLRVIKEWQNFTGTTAGDRGRINRSKKDAEATNNRSMNRLFEEVGGAVLPWPEKKEWRGYPGSMIKRVDGYMFNEGKRDELMLVLPVYINGRYRGGVKALWDKPEKGPSYLNTGGDWVLNYGLLGYDFVRKYDLFGCDSVVLCEGPRDWLRLVLNKIPAIGILGSKMFGERKLMLLMGLGIKKIYTLTDNDSAGIGMARLVESFCENMIDFEELELPRKYDEEGNLIKLDPDDASQKIIDKVKEIVYAGSVPVAPKKKKKKAVTEEKKKKITKEKSKLVPKLKIEQKTKRIGVKK